MAGSRESEWYVLRRCLAILTRLQKGPASSEELLKTVSRQVSADYLSQRQLLQDIRRLREHLDCDIYFARSTGEYELRRIGLSLLDLPEEAEQGLAFLLDNFDKRAPMSDEIQLLAQSVLKLLPDESQSRIKRNAGGLLLDLQPKDQAQISNKVMNTVQRAVYAQQCLEFDHVSPKYSDGQARYYYVEPLKILFSDGHYYLDAYCLRARTPDGAQERNDFRRFRIERMMNPRMLPQRFVPRRQPQHKLVYELAPYIAKAGVTKRFPDSRISIQPDGSAIVSAKVDELFGPLRTLLRYGPGCRVIGGTDAVAEMRRLVESMYQQYAETKDRSE